MTLRNNIFRASSLAAAAVLTFASVTGCGGHTEQPVVSSPSAPASSSGAPVNPYLAAPTYGIVHMDSSQSDTFPYPAPRGVFHIDPRTQPRVAGGPVNIMTLASTSPDYMWVSATSGVRYVDVSGGGFRSVAALAPPGVQGVPTDVLDRFLAQKLTDIAQVKHTTEDEWKLDGRVLGNGTYSLVDRDNRLYYSTAGSQVDLVELIDPANPAAGIRVAKTLDYKPFLATSSAGVPDTTVGLGMTFDGHLAVVTTHGVGVMNRDLTGEPSQIRFGADETVSNSMAIDERGGIYVASDKVMHKLVWTGTRLSDSPSDGAWSAPYDGGEQPPSVKFGSGTGSTPTLMGFGDDPDKLVVITDGADRMKLVAFWRDEIPAGFQQKPDTRSNRIADQIPVTAGLDPLPKFIQSEQSVVVNGYGAFAVNNIRPQGEADRLVDVIAGGPVLDPPHGMQRFQWEPASHSWRSVWTRGDVVSTSMVPAASSASGMVLVNGYTKADGWEVTGLDWTTGQTVQRTIFGQDNLGNGAYALIQFMPNGDLLFNSIGGPFRARLSG